MGLLTDTRSRQSTLVGGCRLERVVLDQPGFPTLYDAVRVETGEKASVRLYEIEADRRTTQRFMRTVERRAALEHPHLIEIHGAGIWEGRFVLATGPQNVPSLELRLQEGPLAPGETIKILSQVADALDFAADGEILDRELGMGSILLDPRRGVQMGDLGIWVPFTPDLAPWEQPYPMHVAPETARGEPLTRASNVYSLASVMFGCLTGAPPYEGHVLKVLESHVSAPPPRPTERDPGLGPEIDRVFEIAMAKDPADRYGTATEMVRAAADALGVAPVPRHTPRRPSPQAPPQPAGRDGSGAVRVVAAVAAAAALAVGGYLLGSSGQDEPAPTVAAPSEQAASAAGALNAELRRVDGIRLSQRARLAAARSRRAQARAATALDDGYQRARLAAAAIARASESEASGLAARLGAAEAAYTRLAVAAREGDRRAYAAASREVDAAEAALRRELANL